MTQDILPVSYTTQKCGHYQPTQSTMKIKKLDVPFAQVANQVLNDPNISLKAKGLFAYIQGKPDDWDFATNRMANESKDGPDSIYSGQKELIENGYLIRKKNGDGTLFMQLILPEPNRENPSQGFSQSAEIPDRENPRHNKEISSTKKEGEETNNVVVDGKNLFEDFWNEYPKRKRDKDKCIPLFEKLSKELQASVVEDVKKRKVEHWDWVKEKHQFVPAPLVYLRNKRWEEQIDGQGKVQIANVYHNPTPTKKVQVEKISV